MTAQTVINFTAAKEARDEGMERAEAHADLAWQRKALAAVMRVCLAKPSFICDDIWEAGLERPKEPRALGAVMGQAVKKGICERTGEYRPSAQVSCHNNPRAVWRSRLFVARAVAS